MYLREFRINRRSFVAACLGMGLGSAFSHYTSSLFGPALIADFGWAKADFALLGSFALVNMFFIPFAGWFVDRFGPRLAAMIGFTAMPLGYIAFTLMTGDIRQFFAITVLQHIFGILTTTCVFARVIVDKFDRARGFALSLMLTAAPLFAVFAVPLLGGLMETYGWRAGYYALAAITAAAGIVAVTMMERKPPRRAGQAPEPHLTRREIAELLRNPTLIAFLLAMFLVNLPQSFANTQLKLILMDSGVASETATWMMSLYAGGVIVGRFLGGLALDRIPPHVVAIAVLGLPAIGYLLFAAHVTTLGALIVAVGLIGFAQGAETDVGAFLLSRRFDTKNFSLLIALMSAMVGLGGAVGSLVMSATLRIDDSYVPFMLLSAVGTLVGAVLFAMAGRPRAEPAVSAG